VFRRIRWRIAVPYVALILGVMAIVVIYLSSTVRRIYLESLEAQLTGEAVLIGDALAPRAPWSQTENLDPAAYRYARLLGARVTIIRSDGTVLGESHRSRIGMDNHLGRPEVQQALHEGAGSSIRYSETVGYDMLYAAVRLGSREEPVGLTRVALPLSEADARVANLQRTLLIGALVTTVLAAGLEVAMEERTARPIRHLTAVVERLAGGCRSARARRAVR
jgi:two-component system phosphate regulon sensor histidine kinase PhoR